MTQNKAKIFLMNDWCNNKQNCVLPGDNLLSVTSFSGAPGCKCEMETHCTQTIPCSLLGFFFLLWLCLSTLPSHFAFSLAVHLAAFGTGIFTEETDVRNTMKEASAARTAWMSSLMQPISIDCRPQSLGNVRESVNQEQNHPHYMPSLRWLVETELNQVTQKITL